MNVHSARQENFDCSSRMLVVVVEIDYSSKMNSVIVIAEFTPLF